MKFTTEHTLAIGANGEAAFEAILKANNFNYKKTTGDRDMRDHVDFDLFESGKTIGVDVKGAKACADEGRMILEVLNVQGREGWVFGKAALIAFLIRGEFWLVQRKKLAAWVNNSLGLRDICGRYVQTKGIATDDKRAIAPDTYSRHNRPNEMVTSIRLADLERMVWQKWAVEKS